VERSGQADRLALGIRTTLTGAAVNILLATAKAVAGVLGHSFALIADAAESLTDVVGSLVILGGLAYSLRPADENHPYGHGKAEPLAAALVAGCATDNSVGGSSHIGKVQGVYVEQYGGMFVDRQLAATGDVGKPLWVYVTFDRPLKDGSRFATAILEQDSGIEI
jgi:hypothetical protein